MNWLDFVFIALVALGIVYGAWKGFVMLAAGGLVVVLGIFAAGHLGGPVGGLLGRFIENEAVTGVAGSVIVFIGVAAVLVFVAYLMRKLLRKINCGGADHILGAVTGGVAGFLLCVAILVGGMQGSPEQALKPIRESALAPLIARVANGVRVWVSETVSNRIDGYIGEIKVPE